MCVARTQDEEPTALARDHYGGLHRSDDTQRDTAAVRLRLYNKMAHVILTPPSAVRTARGIFATQRGEKKKRNFSCSRYQPTAGAW